MGKLPTHNGIFAVYAIRGDSHCSDNQNAVGIRKKGNQSSNQ